MKNNNATTFRQAAQDAISAAALPRPSTDTLALKTHLFKHMRLWDAMLPRKQSDELSGELVLNGFWHNLAPHLKTIGQIDYLSNMIMRECNWFPVPAKCHEIINRSEFGNPFYAARLDDRDRADRLDYEKQKRLAND